MTAIDMPGFAEVDAQISQMQLGMDAAELHGSLCGFLSGGESPGRKAWLARVMAEPDPGQVEDDSPLDQLFIATEALLESPDFGFELLLPDEGASIGERGDALLGWCRGFLGGFGLAAAAPALLSDEASEALQDIARIAASDLAYEGSEADEDALSEIVEFVRVAALLLHGDCVLGAHRDRSLH